MIQTIKDKVVHDIIELWQRPAYRAAAALSLFFFAEYHLFSLVGQSPVHSAPLEPTSPTLWGYKLEKKKRKEKKEAAWSALNSLHTHPLSPMKHRQRRTPLDGTAARQSLQQK